MKPLFDFLVEPIDGKRYDNIRDYNGVKFVISASQEDHKVTQRHAIVIATPKWYEGDIKPGDIIITHHNIFRKMYDMKGREKSSNSHILGNMFLVSQDLIFLCKKADSDWAAPDPYIFVSPTKNPLEGVVEYSCDPELESGDIVHFQPDCEYEFRINDKRMYRMFRKNITMIEN